MILVADSGSTKTDWALINDDGETAKHIQTQGLNPFHMDGAGIARAFCGRNFFLLLPAVQSTACGSMAPAARPIRYQP